MAFFDTYETQLEVLLYVAIAMALGAIIGFERELEDKPAGLRTHMLVAGAAALFVALGPLIVEQYSDEFGSNQVQSDPVRILQAVVTGVSFLGAGTILHDRSRRRVEGLTTAASLLFASTVGSATALGHFILAMGGTGLVVLTLRGVGALEQRMNLNRNSEHSRDSDDDSTNAHSNGDNANGDDANSDDNDPPAT